MKLRKKLAIFLSKAANYVCRKLGRQGVTWAGRIAVTIYPDILKELAGEVRQRIYVTCGTNGKTTTNNMLCSFLRSEGQTVICNSTGSNMLNGVISAFVLAADRHGHLDADYACIEIDEASTLRVFPHFTPDYMILTNLFRDQLDRYGEIDITMDLLRRAIAMAPDCTLIVNADDVLSASLATSTGHRTITYGISTPCPDNPASTSEIREGRFCQLCGEKLDYKFYHFSQLGSYHCPGCGFKRPAIDYDATDITLHQGLNFTLVPKNKEPVSLSSNYRGFYNIYNILAAYAGAHTEGFALEKIAPILKDFKPENGRMEHFHIQGTDVLLNLAKNPAGFNQNISAVMEDSSKKNLIVVINDNAQDGHDISWLWDVDLERFSGANINRIIVSGLRAYDMELRFKYSDIPCEAILSVEEAIQTMLQDELDNLYILVNYTALFGTRKRLKQLEEGEHA
ncbi:MAG: Mur ligase family protein [Lachnospiraceae bacterium]|nr:Mur ligase family protein [Lachnospiraceae bacterium]